MISSYAADSKMYGHIEAIYKYAGMTTSINYIAFSKVEHGTFVPTNGMNKELINLHCNILLMGSYKSELVHKINPLKPVFTVGPYIYYAEPIYSDDLILKMKSKYGKTLLVFPSHSYEGCGTEQNDIAFVNYVMNVVAKSYDTVIVSVYWNDIEDNVFKLFEDAGAILVSSGFRGDPNFIRRLKTLFLLADGVCGDSFGTHIGYSLFMKKKFSYFDANIQMVNKGGEKTRELEQINELQTWVKKCFLNNSTGYLPNDQYYRYEAMWGGFKAIKSISDMKDIIFIGEEIIRRSRGFTFLFDKTVKEMLFDGSLTGVVKNAIP